MPITRKRTPKSEREKKRKAPEDEVLESNADGPLETPPAAAPPKTKVAKKPKKRTKASPKATLKPASKVPKKRGKASPKAAAKPVSRSGSKKVKMVEKKLSPEKAPAVEPAVLLEEPMLADDDASDQDTNDKDPTSTTVEGSAAASSGLPTAAKFNFRQRVFAKDTETTPGMLFYEGVVRRVMYGVQHQRQLRLSTTMSGEEIAASLEQNNESTWWYFIHYNGWNVKWDRWVEEKHLYESTESTKAFCERLHKEVKAIRSTKQPKGLSVALELERRMVQIESEHRLEERKRALAAAADNEDEQARLLVEVKQEEAARKGAATKKASGNKWAKKATLQKEMALRRDHQLQGRRSQATSELLVLPFTLKKILVEDWEIISGGMLAIIPAGVSVRQALQMYLDNKLEHLHKKTSKKEDVDINMVDEEEGVKKVDEVEGKKVDEDEDEAKKEMTTSTADPSVASMPETLSSSAFPPDATKPNEMAGQEREWREMADGVCLFFDQALPERLLYRSEKIQHELLMEQALIAETSDGETGGKTKTNSEIYSCEFLLRMFLRLPALLVGELSEQESKSILAKLNDLMRFLQKHQTTLFTQSHRRWNGEELLRRQEQEGN
jgi:mortality factor 4-like protein 1